MNATMMAPSDHPVQNERVQGPRLAGVWQKTGIGVWALIWLLSLLAFGLAIYNWYRWDSTPAAITALSTPTMTPEDQQSLAAYQDAIRQAGLSLAFYGALFAVLRLLAGIPFFLLSILIVRRRSDRLMAVLFAAVLAVIGAAGRWIQANWRPLPHDFAWMQIPIMLLTFLLDCSVIILYAFPDGRFIPGWSR